MDKKSFFRGFGVGILFAAAILGISFMIRTSDSYVKSRAKELGMGYVGEDSKKVMASGDNVTSFPESSPAASPKATDDAAKTKTPDKTNTPQTSSPEGSKTPEKTAEPKKTTAPKTSSTSKPKETIDMKKEKEQMEKEIRKEKDLIIKAGDWSSTVSKKLEQMGIVKSAVDFDSYLERNGYSSKITAGTYKVSKNDSYSQLARKITGSR